MKLTDKITITNEDNMELMARYPNKYFDLAIVDPPYGIGMGGGKFGNSKKTFKSFHGNDECIPSEDYFLELFRVSKNYIVWGGNYMTEYLPPKSCFIVWDKKQPEDFSMAMAELAVTSFNSPSKIYYKRIVGAFEHGKIHPTEKPVDLYKWLLDKYAKPGDKIPDTHLGSGSIAIACHDYGFDLTACELDTEYYEKAIQRIKNHVSQQKLF